MTSLGNEHYLIHPDVERALKDGKPVVALESTVITHGLPFPDNIKLAKDMELEIREHGCVPATIAIINGEICIGLDHDQLFELVNSENLVKVSVRDIAPTVQAQKSGGTTVAGTLAISQSADIKVFATGGIGGVHRQAPFDISADLAQLARSRLVVVCAGAKAILDLQATLEYLETWSVPVVGYKTNYFPAFYTASSGLKTSTRADSPEEVAFIARTHWDLGMPGAVLVSVPPPAEVAMDSEDVKRAVRTALAEARDEKITGQAVTPFLLGRMSEITGGESLRANLGLLLNNATVASQIAQVINPRR